MSQSLTERYDERIAGILSCCDRLVITGTLPVVCYAAGMTGYLNAKGIRIFDYPNLCRRRFGPALFSGCVRTVKPAEGGRRQTLVGRPVRHG
jgi:hypothetical protein